MGDFTKVFTQKNYIDLAKAVLGGMPVEEAEKVLEEQRKVGGKGEERYWITLNSNNLKTTIQLTVATQEELERLKRNRETYDDVLKRLIASYKNTIKHHDIKKFSPTTTD